MNKKKQFVKWFHLELKGTAGKKDSFIFMVNKWNPMDIKIAATRGLLNLKMAKLI